MNRTPLLLAALAALLAIGVALTLAYRHQPTPQTPPNPAAATAASGACTLLADADFEAIQGEKPRDRTPSRTSSAGLDTSQCYFTLPTASKSVSLVLTERGRGADARDPKKVWQELFETTGKDEREREEARGRAKAASPETVAGLGEEAVWLGNPIGGALYVRSGNRFLRISVGGGETPAQKKDKSVEIARRALARL